MTNVGLSKVISDRPTLMIGIVLGLTVLLGGVYLIAGGEMEASEETFMPDTDAVNASMEIREDFETIRMVQVLVRAEEGNVLLPGCLVEMLRVEKAISEDEGVSKLLMPESNPMRISSIADMLISAKGLLSTIYNMTGMVEPQFLEINHSLGLLYRVAQSSRIDIETSLGTPQLGDTIISANHTFLEQAIQFAGTGQGTMSKPPSRGSDGGGVAMSFNEKIEFLQNLSLEELRNLLVEVMDYDASNTEGMVDAVQDVITTADTVMKELGELNKTLSIAESDPAITGNLQALAALRMLQFMLPPMSKGVSATQEVARGLDIDATTKKLNSGMEDIARGIRLSLTKDFLLGTHYEAEGTIIVVGFNSSLVQADEERDLLLSAEKSMERIIEQQDLASTKMGVTATDLTSQKVKEAARNSMGILLPAAFLLVIIVLAFVYRNLSDMVISLLALGFAIIWTYGLGTIAGFVFNPMTMAAPVLIVGLGIDYGIHLTFRYREERKQGASPREASGVSISWVGSALLIATVTTMVAFLSGLVSELPSLRELGVLCSFGIASAFVIMVTFVPSCRQVLDRKRQTTATRTGKEGRKKKRFKTASDILVTGAIVAEQHPGLVILITLVVTAGSLIAASQLETHFEIEDFLPHNLEYAQNLRYMMGEFNLSPSAEILVKGDLTQPDVLRAIETTTLNMVDDELVAMKDTTKGKHPDVSSILSLMQDVADDQRIADPLDLYDDEFSQMFHSSLVDQDRVPDRDIGGLLEWIYENDITRANARALLHRGSKGVDGGFDSSVIRIGIRSGLREDAERLYQELNQDSTPLTDMVEAGGLERVTVTGSSIMDMQMVDSVQGSMTTSFIFTLVLCFVILTVVFWVTERSIVLGAITMIPVLLCCTWILGTMYLLGVPYTVLTAIVTSLTIGLGVTYGIHLTHRFVEELENTKNIDKSCRETVTHTGTAIFGAAATTVAGFGLLVFSLTPPMKEFGGISALTIIYSFIATVFILPTFLVIWARKTKIRQGTTKTES